MTILVKQFSTASLINLIGIVLAVYVNILILPEIASTEEYGMFRWIERTGVLFANILIFGLHRTYIKFSSDSKLVRSEFDDAIFSRTTLIICATIVILSIAPYFISSYYEIASFKTEYYAIGPMAAGGIAFLLSIRISSAHNKILGPLFVQNIILRIALICSSLLVYFNYYNFSILISAYSWIFFILGITSLIRTWRLTKTTWNLTAITKPLLKKVRSYSKYVVLGTSIDIILATIDIQMLSLLTNFSTVGIYGLAFFFATTIDALRRPISQIVAPKFSRYWNNSSLISLKKLYANSATIQTAITFFCIFIILTNIQWIFTYIPEGERFFDSIRVIQILLIGRFVSAIFGSNGELIATSPYYKVNVKITFIVLACTICFNLVAIPSFGVAGVAYSNVLTLLLLNIMRSGYLYRMCKISPFNKDLLSVVLTGTFIIFISIVMPFEGLYRFIFSMIIVFLALARLKKYFHHML